MTFRELRAGYVPILLSFAAPQLILQTDLVMVSALGAEATAAYVVPLRVALLDAVLMMALGPVASVMVVAAKREGKTGQAVYGALAVAAVLGIAMALAGFVFYPKIAYWVTGDTGVARLAAQALVWYALAAPFRFLAAVAVMSLHALGGGAVVLRWKMVEVGLNALLDTLLIFSLGIGFAGAYMATFGVLVGGCLWSLILLTSRLGVSPCLPGWDWLRGFLRQCGWEAKRVFSTQLFALTVMVLFATSWISPLNLDRLAAYSAGGALGLLLFMPTLALFRFLAFRLSGFEQAVMRETLFRLARAGLPWLLLLALILLAGGKALGERLYGLSGAWWGAIVMLIAFALPIRFLTALLRGALHAGGGFSSVALVDIATLWGIGLPLVLSGLYLGNPYLAFSYVLLPELCALPLLWRRLGPRQPAEKHPPISIHCNYKKEHS